MSSWNIRDNLGPSQPVYEGRNLAAARPCLEEAQHGGQSLGSQVQEWHQVLAVACTSCGIISQCIYHMLKLTTWLYYAKQPPT